ncbi:MAG: hypothetical protein ACK4WH_11065 [Phycisphaerales bacterium]
MDADAELKRLKWVVIAFLVFVLSAVFSWREARYLVFGKTAKADVLSIEQVRVTSRRLRERYALNVKYEFDDPASGVRRETQRVSINWRPPADKVINVQYIPASADSSRIVGIGSNWVYPAIFAASLGFLGFKGFQFWKFYKS